MGAILAELVETGERRGARGRRMVPLSERTAAVEAFSRSGLTMAEYARREGMKYATFAGWVAKAQRKSVAAPPIKFAQVHLPSSAAGAAATDALEVRLVDGTVVRGVKIADLVAVVRALRT